MKKDSCCLWVNDCPVDPVFVAVKSFDHWEWLTLDGYLSDEPVCNFVGSKGYCSLKESAAMYDSYFIVHTRDPLTAYRELLDSLSFK